ncbi:hypothetical protein [Antribacter gilvus]|uniref:hypothetical protein n=1 Tax=Antribacter gilvus TaxID=2304675 RepID=UPI000F76DD01|nr:hypothetical protein [Antribacter gilvus]
MSGKSLVKYPLLWQLLETLDGDVGPDSADHLGASARMCSPKQARRLAEEWTTLIAHGEVLRLVDPEGVAFVGDAARAAWIAVLVRGRREAVRFAEAGGGTVPWDPAFALDLDPVFEEVYEDLTGQSREGFSWQPGVSYVVHDSEHAFRAVPLVRARLLDIGRLLEHSDAMTAAMAAAGLEALVMSVWPWPEAKRENRVVMSGPAAQLEIVFDSDRAGEMSPDDAAELVRAGLAAVARRTGLAVPREIEASLGG